MEVVAIADKGDYAQLLAETAAARIRRLRVTSLLAFTQLDSGSRGRYDGRSFT